MLDKPARKHHVGLALSGGGAKGFVHVGILKAFDEYGIKPEIIRTNAWQEIIVR